MTTQHVDYAASPVPAATQDTGGTDAAAIRPILNGEVATQATLQRPDENLRARTEVIRHELEALKYLADADRTLVMQIEPAPGAVTWNGTVAGGGGGDGKFTITAAKNLVVRPLLAPALSTPAKIVNRTVRLQTNSVVAFGVNPPRAYSGANKISVQFAGGDGQALAVSVSGTPANKLRVTVNTNPGTGTTKTALIDYLNANVTFQGLGLTASLEPGGVGSDIFAPSWTFVEGDPDDYAVFAGAADAERHVITQAGLANFFAQPGDVNLLLEGDVLAIGYDHLVHPTPGTYTGRRQSLADAPESVENVVDGNLFIVRLHPEKLPIAIPVAMVFDNQLILADGTIASQSIETTLTGGTGQLPPVVLPADPPKFLLMAADGNHTWSILTEEMIVSLISISVFNISGSPLELGDSVTGPTFTATTVNDGGNGPGVSAVLTNNSGNGESKNVLPDFINSAGAFSSAFVYTHVAPGANGSVIFTLTVVDDTSPTPATRNVTLWWYRRAYVGVSATIPGAYDDVFLKELMTKDGLADVSVTANPPIGGANFQGVGANLSRLFASRNFRFQANPTNQYVYIAWDAAHGDTANIRDKNNNDFNIYGAFTRVHAAGDATNAITTENAAEIPENYIVYKSNNLLTGPIDFEVV